MAYCTFIRPTTRSARASFTVYSSIVLICDFRNGTGGKHAGTVAGMNPGFFDVLHDARDQDVVAIGKGVHIDLNRVFEEPIDQHRAVL